MMEQERRLEAWNRNEVWRRIRSQIMEQERRLEAWNRNETGGDTV
jgi:hypothetical protein